VRGATRGLRNGSVDCGRGCRAFDADGQSGRRAGEKCALRETGYGAGSREHGAFGLDRPELRARRRFGGVGQHAMMFAVAEATGRKAGGRAIHQRREDQREAEQGEEQRCEGSAHGKHFYQCIFRRLVSRGWRAEKLSR
jgi:hypothetical protein